MGSNKPSFPELSNFRSADSDHLHPSGLKEHSPRGKWFDRFRDYNHGGDQAVRCIFLHCWLPSFWIKAPSDWRSLPCHHVLHTDSLRNKDPRLCRVGWLDSRYFSCLHCKGWVQAYRKLWIPSKSFHSAEDSSLKCFLFWRWQFKHRDIPFPTCSRCD